MKRVKLYNVQRNTTIYVKHLNIEFDGVQIKEMQFEKIDGMYSLCYIKECLLVKLGASTEVYIKN